MSKAKNDYFGVAEESIQLQENKYEVPKPLDMEKNNKKLNANSCCKKKCIFLFLSIVIICVIAFTAAYSPYAFMNKLSGKQIGVGVQLKQQAYQMSAQRYDDRIQDCQSNSLKMSFPDVDYAMFGYNIIYGYPLETGHDPGLTRPIFATDYSQKRFTSDCRYEVPRGYVLVPDVACITSFSSKVVKNSRQFEKSLSVSAEISGGGWGASFSASTSYKKQTSEMSSSESVIILSEAKCNYYFAMLDDVNPPQLHPSFIKAIKTTNFDEDKEIFHLFDTFGTHFLKYVLFGARFVYEHKMSKSKYQKASSEDFSVAVQASYSGLFSLGGGFGLSSGQKDAASKFQESVETKTISIGAPPPAGGDTMKWASTVKETPVPVQYKLESIENLFTELYMKGTDLPYAQLQRKVASAKLRYCKNLFKRGVIDSCGDFNKDYVTFKGKFHPNESGYKMITTSEDECVNSCLEDPNCVFADFHSEKSTTTRRFLCTLYKHGSVLTAMPTETYKSFIFIDAIKLLDSKLTLKNMYIEPDQARKKFTGTIQNQCEQECKNDDFCAGFTHRKLNGVENCYLFQEDKINALKLMTKTNNDNALTVIMSRSVK